MNDLYKSVSEVNQAIIRQGEAMLKLINKSLHSDSDEIKRYVEKRYGRRGLNIVDMITTKDINYLLEEIESFKPEKCESVLNKWADDYDNIALLVSPLRLDEPGAVKEKIKYIARKTPKDYILVNLSGKMEDCTRLLNIIEDLEKEKLLKFKMESDISDSGFCKSLRVKLIF